MQKKHGFLLIELIIGMAIAMAITMILINTLHQTQKARTTLDDYVYVYTQAAILNHQLERDLITAFAPDIIPVPLEKNSENSAQTKNAPADNTAKPQEKQKSQDKQDNQDANENKDSKKQKPFEKPFYATEKDKNLDLLTCITTSPISAYWTNQSGPIKTRMARVIYQLKKDPLNGDSYTLYRKEGQNLDFKSYAPHTSTATSSSHTTSSSHATNNPNKEKKIHEYPMVKNIKTCVITYEVVIEQEIEQKNNIPENKTNNKTDNNNSDKNKKKEYKTFTAWDQEEKSPDQTSNQELNKAGPPLPRLPHTVTVNLVLWNRKRSREFPFTFTYSIAWHDENKKTDNQAKAKNGAPIL